MSALLKGVRRLAIAGLVIPAIWICFGCGGGGGGSSTSSVSGVVTSTTGGRASGTVVAGAAIKAYVWPDLTTVIATATSGSDGRYDISLPASAVGKDIFIVAEKSSGSPPATSRYSTLVNDLPATGTTTADIDPSTTVAAETVAKKAKDGNITDISGSSFSTAVTEVKHNMSGVDALSFVVGGAVIPTAFGGGLVGGSTAATFVANDATIQAALAALNDTGGTDVKQAKRITQMLRDLANSVIDAGNAENDSLNAAIEEQKAAINSSTQISSQFGDRTKFVGTMVSQGDNGAFSDEGLIGKASGAYEQRVVDNGLGGTRNGLVRTGNASDGKSWVVTSTIAGTTQGMVLTITPADPVGAFGLTTSSPNMTLHAAKPADPAVAYDGSLTLTKDGSSNITQAVVHITVQDPALTKAITINGTLTGTTATGSTPANPAYTQFSFTGNLDSQFGTASVGNLVVQYFTSSASGDVKLIQLTNFSLTTINSKPATASIGSAIVDFQAPDPAHGLPHSQANRVRLTGSLQASGHTLTLTNGDIALATTPHEFSSPTVAVTGLSGSVAYTSPVLAFNGTVNGTWENAGATGTSVAAFPKGTVHAVGTLTPKNGTPASAELTLVSSNTVVNNAVTTSLTVTSISYGSESLAGTAQESFAVQNNVVQPNPTVTVDLTHTPSNSAVHLTGPANNLAGTIKTSGGTTVAQIGRASDLQIPDLGTVTIIKYSDNTFETALSILP